MAPCLRVVCIRWLEQSAQRGPASPPRRLAQMSPRVLVLIKGPALITTLHRRLSRHRSLALVWS